MMYHKFHTEYDYQYEYDNSALLKDLSVWLTNTHSSEVNDHGYQSKKVFVGPPKASHAHDISELEKMGIVGLYKYAYWLDEISNVLELRNIIVE